VRVIVVAAIVLLSGCQPPAVAPQAKPDVQPDLKPAAAPTVMPSEAPVAAKQTGFKWYAIMPDQAPQAPLLFGAPNSDDDAITLSCDRGSARVDVQTYNPGTDGRQLYLASGGVNRSFAAERLPADEFIGDDVFSRVDMPVSEPVIAAFRKSGMLAKGAPPIELRTASGDELREIAAFFAVCEG
jgi:hypothetical protein